MGNLFNALNDLKTNIFGGGNTGKTTPILRKSAIGINEESPVSKLEHDPFAYSSIQYPKDLTTNGGIGHYMLFYVNVQDATKYNYQSGNGDVGKVGGVETRRELVTPAVYVDGIPGRPETRTLKTPAVYKTVQIKGGSDLTANYFDGKEGSTINSDVVQLEKQRPRGSGLSSYHKTTKRISDSVALYLPPNVTDSTTAGYTGAATGVLGAAAAGGIGFLKNMAKEDFEAASTGIKDALQAVISEGAAKTATALVETFTESEGTRGLANKIFGQADNPYMEVLFDAMNLRTFTYNFTFSPRNREETEDVQKIIALFRFHMAPELKGAANRFLTLPSEFDIHYMYQDQSGHASENDYYNKIATCVCTAVETNYTPDGVKSFEGGAPTKITMNLSFQETELLTKERIAKGF